jgi:protein TonB
MMAHAIALLDHDDGAHVARWSMAAAVVLAAHVGLIVSYLLQRPPDPLGAPAAPVVILELAPLPVAPASPADLAPGPQMQESPLSSPPPTSTVEPAPPAPQRVEPPPPAPLVEQPVVAIPQLPPQPQVKPEPKPPEPPQQRAEPDPAPPLPRAKPERKLPQPETKRVERQKPAPRTSAAPRSQRRTAERPAAPSPGAVASSAALADWRSQVVSRLQRAKRYPAGAEQRREQGVVTIAFSLSRVGNVLSRRVARSSGNSELDQEALATVQRAAPFPPFPPGMSQASVQLSVPIRFSLR